MNLENLQRTRNLLCDIRDGEIEFLFDYTHGIILNPIPCGCTAAAIIWQFFYPPKLWRYYCTPQTWLELTDEQKNFLFRGGAYKAYPAQDWGDIDIHAALERVEFLIAEAELKPRSPRLGEFEAELETHSSRLSDFTETA